MTTTISDLEAKIKQLEERVKALEEERRLRLSPRKPTWDIPTISDDSYDYSPKFSRTPLKLNLIHK